MNELDKKINEHFKGYVVRKDLVKDIKGNAIVPTFVLEYLLGQFAASDDDATIESGKEKVRDILATHYVHRNQSELVRSKIKEKGRHKIIDKVSVTLNEKDDCYEAKFANLNIGSVVISSDDVNAHKKLLVGGVWCICDLSYMHSEDKRVSPWVLDSIRPIQLSRFDMDLYLNVRKNFTLDEWIDLLIQSIGFNPEMFGKRAKLLQLVRLIPFVERNFNLVELGPKGTGKSHIYSEFSPHGMLISGGEVTAAKLFVNNSTGKIGLVGYWNTVAFDEFAGKKKRTEKALVDIMKNYMANKTFSRGIETLGAEASLVFVGNTQQSVPWMLKNADLFDELPENYHDPASLDRIHYYIPGWEFDAIRNEMFSDGYGFVVDYIAEVLKAQRDLDFSDKYKQFFSLSDSISTRDRDGVHKSFSGLMKLLFPHGEFTKEEAESILRFSIEGRKRVKDQICRIDKTMAPVDFSYSDGSEIRGVNTLEEKEYPQYYYQESKEKKKDEIANEDMISAGDGGDVSGDETRDVGDVASGEVLIADEEYESSIAQDGLPALVDLSTKLFEGVKHFDENQTGVTYRNILLPYLKDATNIKIIDPYVREFYQQNNLMELITMICEEKEPATDIVINLVTCVNDKFADSAEKQESSFESIKDTAYKFGIHFTYSFDAIHDRWIQTNTGWNISLSRGLDIYQKISNDTFDLQSRVQEFRRVKEFSLIYTKEN